jgi:hypothetical protein
VAAKQLAVVHAVVRKRRLAEKTAFFLAVQIVSGPAIRHQFGNAQIDKFGLHG